MRQIAVIVLSIGIPTPLCTSAIRHSTVQALHHYAPYGTKNSNTVYHYLHTNPRDAIKTAIISTGSGPLHDVVTTLERTMPVVKKVYVIHTCHPFHYIAYWLRSSSVTPTQSPNDTINAMLNNLPEKILLLIQFGFDINQATCRYNSLSSTRKTALSLLCKSKHPARISVTLAFIRHGASTQESELKKLLTVNRTLTQRTTYRLIKHGYIAYCEYTRGSQKSQMLLSDAYAIYHGGSQLPHGFSEHLPTLLHCACMYNNRNLARHIYTKLTENEQKLIRSEIEHAYDYVRALGFPDTTYTYRIQQTHTCFQECCIAFHTLFTRTLVPHNAHPRQQYMDKQRIRTCLRRSKH